MKKLCIVGTGSQGRYVVEIINKNKFYTDVKFVDIENEKNVGNFINGVEVVCLLNNIQSFINPQQYGVIIAYGNNRKKKEIVEVLQKYTYKFETLISSQAYISSNVEIGLGCIINPNVTILPNTMIGNHVIIHSGSVIEHDNIINNFVNVAPSVTTAGYVNIDEGAYLYTGAVVVPKIKIGSWSVIGAGAIVLHDVKSKGVYVGNPARSIKSH